MYDSRALEGRGGENLMDQYRSQRTEVINRNTVVSLALEQGYNAFLPVYDGGVDFVLYRESDDQLRKVQLKAVGRSIGSILAATFG
jgi:hypothetical protein